MKKYLEKESKYLELKEGKTNTYLKTVCAFSNYHDGRIVFGVKDDGTITPISDQVFFSLSIENQINDNIKPNPNYRLASNPDGTVTLFVFKGYFPPYFYNGKSYKRNDTSSIPVEPYELKRLAMESENLTFDELQISKRINPDTITFRHLEEKLREKTGVNKIDFNILKTLNLYTDNSYNNAALLLSDVNNFYGIEIGIFEKDEIKIKEQMSLSNMSIIEQYEKAMEIYRKYYVLESTDVGKVNRWETVPEIAFKEILTNALMHRTYDTPSPIIIKMYEDRIDIASPGGLPASITKDQYINGEFSSFRNPIIVNVFHLLGIIARFATGMKNTFIAYRDFDDKPSIKVYDNLIIVSLPVENKSIMFASGHRFDFFLKMSTHINYSRDELERLSGYDKYKLLRALNVLIDYRKVEKIGIGKATYYHRVR